MMIPTADQHFNNLGFGRTKTVTYTRNDTSFNMTVIPMLATRYAEEFEGTVENIRRRDYIVKLADLSTGLPKQGDTITQGSEIWMLLETAFEEMTADGELLRLHAMYHKDTE